MLLAAAVLAANLSPRAAPRLPAPAAPSAALAAPVFRAGELYDRPGTGLLVIDIKDSTALHLNVGNRAARVLADAVLDYAEATAARFDGAVARRLGDGQLIAFPSAADALKAAAAIQSRLDGWNRRRGAPDIRLRAGVDAGRVLVDAVDGRDVLGAPAERAVALADRSRGGEIAVAPELAFHPAAKALAAKGRAAFADDGALFLRPRAARGDGDPPALQAPLGRAEFTKGGVVFWKRPGLTFEPASRAADREALLAFRAAARAAAAAEGGELVKTPGDTAMAVFPSPGAALRAALALRAAVPGAKAGLSWGRVQRQDRLGVFDYFGNVVNAAARFASLARPGEVAAGESLAQDAAAAALMESGAPESALLKGFKEPVRLRRL